MTNIVAILKEYSIDHREAGQHHHVSAGYVGINCPFCGKDNGKFHLGINLEKLFCVCWRCGSHSLVATLVELTGLSWRQCKDLVKDIPGQRLDRPVKGSRRLVEPAGLGELLPAHQRYLKGRGFDPGRITKEWGVRGIGLSGGRLRWRLWLPVVYQGKTVSWTTRAIVDEGTRYLSATANESLIDIKDLLYGQDRVGHTVLVVEGPLDVWKIGPGAVCTFGVNYSLRQLQKLANYPERLVCFDNEPDAQKRARKLCEELSVFPGVTKKIVLDAKDAGSASEQELDLLRRMLR